MNKSILILWFSMIVSLPGQAFETKMKSENHLALEPCFLVLEQTESFRDFHEISSYAMEVPDFSASGLNYEVELTDLFMGNFEDVPFKRSELFFGLLFSAYVSEFAKSCDDCLPPDKIPLTEQECVRQQIVKNGFGMELSRNCVQWRTVETGYFAAPDMYAALQNLEQYQLRNVLSVAQSADVLGSAAKMSGELKAVHMDMVALIRMNGCDSPGLKQFQENLRLFALGQRPIRIESLIAKRKEGKGEIATNQDLKALVEDLVYENSRQWNFNRYHQGSVDHIQVLFSDGKGRPRKLKADYLFSGFSGKSQGSVTVTFGNNGLPDCLFFSDFPDTCRPASRKIVNAYAQNNYASKAIPESPPTSTENPDVTSNNNNQEVPTVPYAIIEEAPVFPGCENEKSNEGKKRCNTQKINDMVNENFSMALAEDLGVTVRLFVIFKIDQNGYITDIGTRSPTPELQQEAVRVLKLLPKMEPGKQRGQPVVTVYSMPLVFRGNDNSSKNELHTTQIKQKTQKKEPENEISNKKLKQLFGLDEDDK